MDYGDKLPPARSTFLRRRAGTFLRRRAGMLMARGAVEQAGGVLHRAADENGVDPRPNPHDTAHMGRALHGSGGGGCGAGRCQQANGAGAASFSAARVYSRGSPCQLRGTAAASQPKQESRRPPAVDKQPAAARLLAVAAAGYLSTAAPSQLPPANHAATAPRCPMSLKSPSKRGFSSPPTASKGDASLSARGADSPASGAAGVRDSAAGARHACDGPGSCSGSADRHGAASAAAPPRRSSASSRCCRGRSAGRGRPGDDRRRSCTGGRRSSSRPMRTGWTHAQTRTILRIWAVPCMARGGAVPVVATKQTAPAPHRSQRPECTPAAPLVRSAEPPPASPLKQESRRPPAVDK